MNDFSKAVEGAQRMPQAIEELEGKLPDLFGSKAAQDIASRVEGDMEGKIPGAAQYDFDYNCKRFMMGQHVVAFERGNPIYEDIDESEELQKIMDMNLKAEAIIFKKMETFLKDGTVIIWIEYGIPKTAAKKKTGVLSIAELLSPKPSESEFDEDDSEGFGEQ